MSGPGKPPRQSGGANVLETVSSSEGAHRPGPKKQANSRKGNKQHQHRKYGKKLEQYHGAILIYSRCRVQMIPTTGYYTQAPPTHYNRGSPPSTTILRIAQLSDNPILSLSFRAQQDGPLADDPAESRNLLFLANFNNRVCPERLSKGSPTRLSHMNRGRTIARNDKVSLHCATLNSCLSPAGTA